MQLFYLEDLVTGHSRSFTAPEGTTEIQVRARFGGIWLDAERTICPTPCRLPRRTVGSTRG